MVYIYALVSGQLILYVGQTKDVKIRERGHRNRKSACASRHIPDYIDWTMKVLEETTDALGTQREQYYYDTLKPLYNHVRPMQTRREYRITHFDKRKEYYEEYKNSEQYKQYNQSEHRKALKLAYSQTEHAIQQRKEYRQKLKEKNNNITAN